MKVTIPEALELSLLGMIVVFVVLVFLMCITYILAVVFKPRKAKQTAAVVEGAVTNALAAAPAEAAVAALELAAPAEAAAEEPSQAEAAADTAAEEPAPSEVIGYADTERQRQFKVIINGVEHSVDAVVSESEPGASGGAPLPAGEPAVSAPRASAAQAPVSAQTAGRQPASEQQRQFRIIINGAEHMVGAEITEPRGGAAV